MNIIEIIVRKNTMLFKENIMFLNRLSDERKKDFLQLCYHAASADCLWTDEELNYIDEFAKELGLSSLSKDEIQPIDEIYLNLKESTDEESRIILAEIIALLKIDHSFDKKETDFVKRLSNELCFEEKDLDSISTSVDEYLKGFYSFYNCVIMNRG